MSDDEQRANAIKSLNDEGARRFGKAWEKSIAALETARPRHVAPEEILRAAAGTGDAAGALHRAGMDALISQADNDTDAARAYSAIREEQRKQHAISKGRRF